MIFFLCFHPVLSFVFATKMLMSCCSASLKKICIIKFHNKQKGTTTLVCILKCKHSMKMKNNISHKFENNFFFQLLFFLSHTSFTPESLNFFFIIFFPTTSVPTRCFNIKHRNFFVHLYLSSLVFCFVFVRFCSV
jgi:hypothetical protein